MSGFSVDWLTLREPFDQAARADSLAQSLNSALSNRPGPIIDLGCGTGSTTRALARCVGTERPWLLVDHDPVLLAETANRIGPTMTCDTLAVDLAADLKRVPFQGAALITCSALIDLVSSDWLTGLVGHLERYHLPFYAALTYNGEIRWAPDLPHDGLVSAAFNQDMRTDKGFGPALGGDSAAMAAKALRGIGFTVREADSPWRMAPTDQAMQQALLEGIAGAATTANRGAQPEIAAWKEARAALIREGRSHLVVGHTDILALPNAVHR